MQSGRRGAAEFFQENQPELIVVLQAPKKADAVTVVGVLQAELLCPGVKLAPACMFWGGDRSRLRPLSQRTLWNQPS